MRIVETDCLVVGAGLAGSAYALHAARAGLRVALLSLGDPLQANSDWAQGGIVFDESPDPAALAGDIVAASSGTANDRAVEQLVHEGPGAVRELLIEELAVEFDRDAGGQFNLSREGGHRSRRIIHSKDSTGHAILAALAARITQTQRISRHVGNIATDLVLEEGRCAGCTSLDAPAGELLRFAAGRTVLATGGLAGIYRLTTNQPGSVGHGIAMAARAGAGLADLEYVQFHPTVFMHSGRRPFLITEALRGEGAVIVDRRGERFMDRVHPLQSLAPRDLVSREISLRMARSGDECVYLDLSALSAPFIRSRFPAIHAHCLSCGLDITKERIPVVPAAHFSCGGIVADLHGRTSVQGLSAIGETACTGLHGANRLASTSLLECLVAAKAAAAADSSLPFPRPTRRLRTDEPRAHRGAADPEEVARRLESIREAMWEDVGIVRTPAGLARAVGYLAGARSDAEALFASSQPAPGLIELRNAADTALRVARAAAGNPVSKGCHYLA